MIYLAFDIYDAFAYAIWIFLAAMIGGLGYYGIQKYKERERQQRFLDEAAERAFEKEALGEIGVAEESSPPAQTGAPAPASAAEQSPPQTTPAPFPFAPAAQPAPQPSTEGTPEEQRLAALVHRLKATRVVTDREGQLSLGLPPEAPIFRLRRGGLAVVLPRVESEALLANLTSRFDIVFIAAADGRSLVLERFENRLNDLVEDDGAFPPGGIG